MDDLLDTCTVRSGHGAETQFPALSGRNILVFESISWAPHTPTSGEIALRFAEQGNAVTLVLARGIGGYFEDRPLKSSRFYRWRAGLKYRPLKAALKGTGVDILQLDSRGAARPLPPVADLEALKDYVEDGWDIGLAVASSLISHTRSTDFPFEDNRPWITAAYNSSRLTYHAARALIEQRRPDLVVLFNGRFTVTRAVLRAAEALGVPYLVHERGCDKEHFMLLPFMPHLAERRSALILKLYAQEDPRQAAEIADRFYARRRSGGAKEWVSFAKWQPRALSPQIEALPAPPVTFLVSSEDEMAAVGLDRGRDAFGSQGEAIGAIAQACAERGQPFVVRVHPHFAKKDPADLRALLSRVPASALVVNPADNVDTYSLIARSRAVISYGSTAGIESVYMGVPHLLLSRSLYEALPGIRRAASRDDVWGWLDRPEPSPREGAIVYGWYLETYGIRHREFQASDLFSGTFRGRAFGNRKRLKRHA